MSTKRFTRRLEARVDPETLLLLDRLVAHYRSTRSHVIRLAVVQAANAVHERRVALAMIPPWVTGIEESGP